MKLVMMYGRFNPPTIKHKSMFEYVWSLADRDDHEALIATSPSCDELNPLPSDYKVELLRSIVPKGVVVSDSFKSPWAAADFLCPLYDEVLIICGDDRKRDYDRLKTYHKNLSVGVIPRTDVSASRLRLAVAEDDFNTFIKYYGGPRVTAAKVFAMIKNYNEGNKVA